jgi:hypothetical protein
MKAEVKTFKRTLEMKLKHNAHGIDGPKEKVTDNLQFLIKKEKHETKDCQD